MPLHHKRIVLIDNNGLFPIDVFIGDRQALIEHMNGSSFPEPVKKHVNTVQSGQLGFFASSKKGAVIWARNNHYEILAHECFHLVEAWARWTGIQDEEARAVMLTGLLAQIRKLKPQPV